MVALSAAADDQRAPAGSPPASQSPGGWGALLPRQAVPELPPRRASSTVRSPARRPASRKARRSDGRVLHARPERSELRDRRGPIHRSGDAGVLPERSEASGRSVPREDRDLRDADDVRTPRNQPPGAGLLSRERVPRRAGAALWAVDPVRPVS